MRLRDETGDGGYDGTPSKWVGNGDDEHRHRLEKNTRSTEGRVGETMIGGLVRMIEEKRKEHDKR